MSVGYRAVQWSPYKRRYDATLAASVLAFISAYVAVSVLGRHPVERFSVAVLFMRGVGVCGYVLLHVILCIGPLARLDRRFLPLLYNRRHLGVTVFLLGLLHAAAALGYYHGFGVVSPPVSLLTSNVQYRSVSAFPFEVLGLVALMILFLLAATSHDFWLKNLSPRAWKSLHMLVYAAWALLVLHVALGALQAERGMAYPGLVFAGVAAVGGLHVVSGWRERLRCRRPDAPWVEVGGVEDFREGVGRVVCVRGRERVALFRHEGRFHALSNTCAHQGGPLGEGRVIDGCVTCPWHGWQYRAQDGCSPPPFSERVATYPVRVVSGRVQVGVAPTPVPTPPGSRQGKPPSPRA